MQAPAPERILNESIAHGARFATPAKLGYACERTFADVPLERACVLEIGAGMGAFCVWAASRGAHAVIGLEPEEDGCNPDVARKFQDLIRVSGLMNVSHIRETIQDYKMPSNHFDVIVSVDSMEHLDEVAVTQLPKDAHSYAIFRGLFEKILNGLKPGGSFIICNVGKTNIWPMLGLKCPFAPTISWRLHPDAYVWRQLLLDSGFQDVHTDWWVRYPLRHFRPLVANRYFTFLTDSRFRVVARKGRPWS